MATLLTFDRKLVNRLYPRTLYMLGCKLSALNGCINLRESDQLADLPANIEIIPSSENELLEDYRQYKEEFMDAIRGLERVLDNSNKTDFAISILLHDLCQCATDELVEKLEQRPSVGVRNIAGLCPLEYVVRVYLHKASNENIIRQVVQNAGRNNKRGFHYYTVDKKDLFKPDASVVPEQPPSSFKDDYEKLIEPHIQTIYGTQMCEVRIEELKGKWYIEILHGGKKAKTETEKNAVAEDILLQPLLCDTIIFDTRTYDIRTHMHSRRPKVEKEVYVAQLAKCLKLNGFHWVCQTKFDLDKFRLAKEELNDLLDSAGKAMSTPQVGNVKVTLVDVYYEEHLSSGKGRASTTNTHKISNKTVGLNGALQNGQKLLPIGTTITKVVLRTQYSLNKKNRKPSIEITSESLPYPVLPHFEEWLEEKGISINYNEPANEN